MMFDDRSGALDFFLRDGSPGVVCLVCGWGECCLTPFFEKVSTQKIIGWKLV